MEISSFWGFFGLQETSIYVQILYKLIQIVVVFSAAMLHVAYSTWWERKIIGHMQVRLGPMKVGYHGLLQPIADGVKLFFKEDIIPSAGDKVVFKLSPMIALFATVSSLAVIPFYEGFVIANINVGLLYLFAMSSLGAYGIIMSGWSSNSKYAFLGGLRSAAQVVSYEIALALSLVGIMMLSGSLNLVEIVRGPAETLVRYVYRPSVFCLHHLHDLCLCRNQQDALRSAGGRKRARCRIFRRVQRNALRPLLHGRIYCDDRNGFHRRNLLLGRLDASPGDHDDLPVPCRRPGSCMVPA